MSVRVQIQKFGSKLSSMVIPNLGAFIAWGLLTAVGIAIDNDMLRSFITPVSYTHLDVYKRQEHAHLQ